ncbi:MAG: hypothetical protein ABI200_03895 [Gaiellales bacterium]
MLGTDTSGSNDRLDPRRRDRYARVGAPGTATTLRFDGLLGGLRSLLASLIVHLQRR